MPGSLAAAFEKGHVHRPARRELAISFSYRHLAELTPLKESVEGRRLWLEASKREMCSGLAFF
jgi:hypothetical protein